MQQPDPDGLELDIQQKDGVLYLRAKGVYSQSVYLHMAHRIREHALATGNRLVLADARQVVGNPSDSDRIHMGLAAAELWAGVVRVAMVCRPEVITRFAESLAQNRGADFMVTDREEEARDWLTS